MLLQTLDHEADLKAHTHPLHIPWGLADLAVKYTHVPPADLQRAPD